MRAKAVRAARWTAITIVTAIALFLLTAWIGSSIPRNSDWNEPDDGVEIMIGSNGIHTEIIMPIATETIDWSAHFPVEDIIARGRDYTHVSVSWGERKFFLETPTWADVKISTVANAMTGGEGVLHVAWYLRPMPAEDFRVLRVRQEEYRELAAVIAGQLRRDADARTYPGYAAHDVFYDAIGTYHIGNTCNQWTSDQLAKAGIKVGWWSPMPGGVMKWVPDPD